MNQSNLWATNLKHLRNRRKLSQDELAAQLSITRSKLNAHENGLSKNPPVEDLLRFSAFFKLGIDTLLKVDLTKLSDPKLAELEAGNDMYATGRQLRILATTVDGNNEDNIELVPVKARAGYASGYGDPDFISKLPVFSMPHLPRDRKYRMFPTIGDSMYPVPEGAFVIGEYLEDWKSIKEETPCIVITNQEGIVFKLVSIPAKQSKTLLLQSLNTAYAPYEIDVADVLEIWKFKSLVTDTLPDREASLQQMARTLQEVQADIKRLVKNK